MALEERGSEGAYREAIGGMLEETARLNQTIEGLLLLAKTETSDAEATITPFALPQLIDEILPLLDVLLEERRILVRQEGAASLTEPVHADRSLIRIALLTVLHNAVKFSPENSTIAIIYSHAMQQGRSRRRVSIQDRGPGIADGERERVFERFFTSAQREPHGRVEQDLASPSLS